MMSKGEGRDEEEEQERKRQSEGETRTQQAVVLVNDGEDDVAQGGPGGDTLLVVLSEAE